jgi:hypothetical protein
MTGEFRGLPKSFFKSPTFWAADIVFLHRHRIGHSILQHPFKRRPQIADASSGRIVPIIGEHIKELASHNYLPARLGGLQVGVARGHDGQISGEGPGTGREPTRKGIESRDRPARHFGFFAGLASWSFSV